MKKYLAASVLVFVFTGIIQAQAVFAVQSLSIIDCPTAATLERGSYFTALDVYDNGGLLGTLEVGISDRIMFGISFGGTNLIGSGPVEWNPSVAVNIRYRLIDEHLNFPSAAIGFEGQGRGVYLDSLDRYSEKSKGAYLALSKSYKFLGTMALHGGLNYSFEREDQDKDLNAYFGIEKSINEELGMFFEYDLAMNDNTGKSIGAGKGYFNAGLKWIFQGKVFVNFVWKNILKNKKDYGYSGREIRLGYVEYF